ncbi:PLD nuclease N-terminal domain-containing protein [Streptomyces sp. TG1A-60]|uniref:PLD nuclease N-terminal domain-containing protein n=1 Tax=Streptomyces sp. TG1A-60 TaxID=3129111 RepID=UPI0030D31012
MLRVLLYLVPLALTIYAFIDCLNTPEDEAKHLPKIAWVFIILLFWIVGPVAWIFAGKVRGGATGGGGPSERPRGRRTAYVAPDDNPEFLKSLSDGNKPAGSARDDDPLLKSWEADLRRREEELKRQEEEKRRGEKKDSEE